MYCPKPLQKATYDTGITLFTSQKAKAGHRVYPKVTSVRRPLPGLFLSRAMTPEIPVIALNPNDSWETSETDSFNSQRQCCLPLKRGYSVTMNPMLASGVGNTEAELKE